MKDHARWTVSDAPGALRSASLCPPLAWFCELAGLALIALALSGCDGPSRSKNAAETPSTRASSSSAVSGRVAMTDEEKADMKIQLIIDDAVLNATLVDSASARDFASLLPLDLELRDYAGKEKVSDLPRKLTTEGAPAGVDPEVGDLTYYAPWGNLAIFYRDFGYSDGLVKLGHIDSGMEKLANQRGEFAVRIQQGEE